MLPNAVALSRNPGRETSKRDEGTTKRRIKVRYQSTSFRASEYIPRNQRSVSTHQDVDDFRRLFRGCAVFSQHRLHDGTTEAGKHKSVCDEVRV